MKKNGDQKENIKKIVFKNEMDPITLEKICDLPQKKVIPLQIDNMWYGFDVDSLNEYISKNQTEQQRPKNPFTNQPFSKQIMNQILNFNKRHGYHVPEREHSIWKKVDELGHEIQCKLSLEQYKKYDGQMNIIKKNWNDFKKNAPVDLKLYLDDQFQQQIHFHMKIFRKEIHNSEDDILSSSEESEFHINESTRNRFIVMPNVRFHPYSNDHNRESNANLTRRRNVTNFNQNNGLIYLNHNSIRKNRSVM